MRAAGAHYDDADPAARRATPVGRAAASCSSRRATPTCRRGSGSPNARPGATEISARRRARDGARARRPIVRALHHPGAARVDGRLMCAALPRGRGRATASRCATSASTTCARSPADARRDRGRRVDAARSREQLGVTLPVGPVRGQIIHLGVAGPRHRRRGRSCSRCSATTWCRGPTRASRSARPSKTPASLRRSPPGGVHEVLRETLRVHARPRAARRCARCASACGRRASTTCRSSARSPACRHVFVAHRPRRQRPAARPGLRCARRRRSCCGTRRPRSTSPPLQSPTRDFGATERWRQRSSFRARSAMMFFWTSVGPAPIVV